MFDIESASVALFVLSLKGGATPYYENVPEGFERPAVFFPVPRIKSYGDTLDSFELDYTWYLKIFHETSPKAFKIAFEILERIRRQKNLIELFREDGTPLGESLRIDDPSLKDIDDGVVELTLSWSSYRPYDRLEGQKVLHFYLNKDENGG